VLDIDERSPALTLMALAWFDTESCSSHRGTYRHCTYVQLLRQRSKPDGRDAGAARCGARERGDAARRRAPI